MKPQLTLSLCAAIAFMAYAYPTSARAQSGSNPAQQTSNGSQVNNNGWSSKDQKTQQNSRQPDANKSANSPAARDEAMNMVAAQADLTRTLDARNAHPGEQIRATLQDAAQLKNGPELPKGTILLGKVTANHVKPEDVRMAVRFDHAKLTDGKTIPVKATIVGITPPQNGNRSNGTAQPSSVGYAAVWTPNTLQVDQVNVLSGVDLHSRIHSRNSAVFVSHSKNDLQLNAGSQLALAIGEPMHNSTQHGNGAPGM